MKTAKLPIHSLDTVLVEDWLVRCSMMKGNILIVMLNSITEETRIGFFNNEKEANYFVNNICYRIY
jgi:hypothetical protein